MTLVHSFTYPKQQTYIYNIYYGSISVVLFLRMTTKARNQGGVFGESAISSVNEIHLCIPSIIFRSNKVYIILLKRVFRLRYSVSLLSAIHLFLALINYLFYISEWMCLSFLLIEIVYKSTIFWDNLFDQNRVEKRYSGIIFKDKIENNENVTLE